MINQVDEEITMVLVTIGFDFQEDEFVLTFSDGWIAEIRICGQGVFQGISPFSPSDAIRHATQKVLEMHE